MGATKLQQRLGSFARRAAISGALVLLGTAFALGGGACGADGRYIVIGTSRAQAASGTLEVDRLDGSSTQVAVHLEHLYPPARLGHSLTRYAVWFVPPTGAPASGGDLKFNREERTGDLTATSPFRHFTVRITAEAAETASAPGASVVVEQRVALD